MESVVLAGRLRGLTVKEVASELGMSYHTACYHLKCIHKKLEAHSLQQVVCAFQKESGRRKWNTLFGELRRRAKKK
jgi:DNA-binding NarL/FixJ family response regulator